MTSLVAGANGYIGRKIIEVFSENNLAVLVCVRTLKQAEALLADSVVIEDISLFTQWHPVLERVYVVVHLAARAHVLQENSNSSKAIDLIQSINRRIIDHTADISLTYNSIAREYLIRKGLPPDLGIKIESPMFEVLSHYHQGIDGSDVL